MSAWEELAPHINRRQDGIGSLGAQPGQQFHLVRDRKQFRSSSPTCALSNIVWKTVGIYLDFYSKGKGAKGGINRNERIVPINKKQT